MFPIVGLNKYDQVTQLKEIQAEHLHFHPLNLFTIKAGELRNQAHKTHLTLAPA